MTINRTARETRSRIERVFEAAESKGLRSGKNPAMWKTLKPLLPKAKRSKRCSKGQHAGIKVETSYFPDAARLLRGEPRH
jgi:hypothetical protein